MTIALDARGQTAEWAGMRLSCPLFLAAEALVTLVALSASQMAMAQDAPSLCSDRPGNATPTCVAQAGTIQLETSLVDWTHDDGEGYASDSYLFGDSLLKFGISGDTELRVAFTPYAYQRQETPGDAIVQQGIGDIALSARHRVIDGGSQSVSFAVQPFVALPVGADEVSDGTWSAGLVAPIDVPLDGGWGFNLSPVVAAQADSDGEGRHLLYSGTAAIGHSLGNNVAGTVELFAQRDRDPAGRSTVVTADAMLAWQPSPDTQFDVSAYAGLSDDAPGIELIAGFTRRFRR